MAITLTDLAQNSTDAIKQGFINEIITDSFILANMPFDDCMTASGTSDLVYGYKRVTTHAQAAFRALNSEPTTNVAKVTSQTTKLGILSHSWEMDRVAKAAAEDLYELQLEESKNAIIRQFNATLINGTGTSNSFDGLDKAIKGTSTDATSTTDLSVVTQAAALAYAEELDGMIEGLMRTPDVLLVSPAMKTKLNAVLRVLGLATTTKDDAGRNVNVWGDIRVEVLRDGALATNDVYAVCFGLDAFHGITLKGDSAISVALPDWTTPGAVKKGDSEFVCGCALKATKAAGVLRAAAAGGGE